MMTDCMQNKDARVWQKMMRVLCLFVFLFFMAEKLNCYLADSFLHSYYIVLAVVMVSFSLYFYRLQEGKEIKILAAYWLWFAVSRILGGDVILEQYGVLLLSLAICFAFTGLGIRSSAEERTRDMTMLCVASCVFYFVMGLICLYGMFLRKPVLNPITETYIVYSDPDRFIRMGLFETHSNTTAAMFMVPIFLLIHQLVMRKKIGLTILAVPALLVYILCIGLTYSRNGMICTSLGFALLVIIVILHKMEKTKVVYKIVAVILVLAVVVPLGYKFIGTSVKLFGQSSTVWLEMHSDYSQTNQRTIKETSNELAEMNLRVQEIGEQTGGKQADSGGKSLFEDKRNFFKDARTLTERTPLFRSAFLALKEEPIRILIGENDDEKMLYYANNVVQTKQHFSHMHNFLLQTLMVTGLPGLVLVLWFCIRLIGRCIQVYFRMHLSLADKTLVIPIACYLLFYQLESGLFTDVTVVTLYFFITAGYVLAISE